MLDKLLTSAITPVDMLPQFRSMFESLYSFSVHRNILDVALSVLFDKRLTFRLEHKKVLERKDGFCRTSIAANGKPVFMIQLAEHKPYVLIHEIAHLIEHEILIPYDEFLSVIYDDFAILDKNQKLKLSNPMVYNLVQQVIFKEIQAYGDVKSRASELFVRYFELHGRPREIHPAETRFTLRFADIADIFPKTNQWISKVLNPLLARRIHPSILEYSRAHPPSNTRQIKWGDTISKNRPVRKLFDEE